MLAHDEVGTEGDVEYPSQGAGKDSYGSLVYVRLPLGGNEKEADDKDRGDEYCHFCL